jgi:hypothetical protein
METGSGLRGMRGLVWTAALVSAAFSVPASAHAACSQVKETTPEWYFAGTRCNNPGIITRTGAYTTHDDKATLNGTVTRRASNGTVSIEKTGQLMSPSFEGTVQGWSAITTSTGQVQADESRTGVAQLPDAGLFGGTSRETRNDQYQELVTERYGQIAGPTFEGTVQGWSVRNTGTGALEGQSTYVGTWPLERLAGELTIMVHSGQVSVQDNRQSIP